MAVSWLALVKIMLECVVLVVGVGVGGREVGDRVDVKLGYEETPIVVVAGCAVCVVS